MRYLIDVVLRDKSYVVLNVDETSVNSIVQHSSGYVLKGLRRHRSRQHAHRREHVDRSNTKTTLMGLICDQPNLQPYLPQVFMPKYTQNAQPPLHVREEMGRQGFPFQYWHGTGGSSTPRSFREWANTVRRTVHSFDPDIWMLLVMDCHSSHLDVNVVRHLHHLGFLVITVPAKLTWLLQPLDVYIFAEFKRNLRRVLAHRSAELGDEDPRIGAWITPTASAARRVLVRIDWSSAFSRLGAGLDLEELRPAVRKYVGSSPIVPALPKLADFATLLSRVQHTSNTRQLHVSFMQQAMKIRDLPGDANPPRGAVRELPDLPPATVPRRNAPDGNFDNVLRRHLCSQREIEPVGGIIGDAAIQLRFARAPRE